MNKIRPWLYIGRYDETRNSDLLAAHNIGAMLQLAGPDRRPDFTSLHLPVSDGLPLPEDRLRKGVEFVIEQMERGQTVLVVCAAGISRSASFCTAALKEAEDLSLLEALQVVRQKHPPARPHPALWNSLCAYYGEDVCYDETI